MKPASLSQLKQELKNRSKDDLVELCLSLTRYKKENKELLTYLLFEAADEFSYVKEIKSEIDEQFTKINKSTPYFIKKGVREDFLQISQLILLVCRKYSAKWYFVIRLDKNLSVFGKNKSRVQLRFLSF